jgi:hypothetical protein
LGRGQILLRSAKFTSVGNSLARNERSKKLHQFLFEVGVKALRQHLGQLLGIAQVSTDKTEYEKHVRRIFGSQQEMDF